MTHPDDEIAICVWIKRLVDNGNQVFMSWTHSNPVREAEARAVAAWLGVPAENLRFFAAADQGCCDEIPRLLPLFSQMMQDFAPDVVVCGAFEQGHIDHDATNYLVNNTFNGPVYETPLYHTYLTRLQRMNVFSDPDGESVLPLTNPEGFMKMDCAKRYPSQNIWSVLYWYELWQAVRFRPLVLRERELLRVQTHRDWLTPNHNEPLRSRVAASAIWKRWCAAVQRANETVR